MPEGPEAKCVADDLHLHLEGGIITSVTIYPLAKGDNLSRLRENLVLEKVYSKGKKVILCFGNENLVTSLGMEGKYRYEEPSHVHFHLTFLVKNEVKNLYYSDHRFGSNKFCEDEASFRDAVKNVGPDLLQDDIPFEKYTTIMDAHKRSTISNWIYEQSYFSGIGNYLRSEILYKARIHPKRKISSLTLEEKKTLYSVTKDTIQEAYEKGGLTIRSYSTPSGRKGLYNPAIYGRETDDDGNVIQKIKASNGQTIYFVEKFQLL